MGRFDKYNVDLKGLKTASLEMEFDLDNAFFGDIDGIATAVARRWLASL